jgi:membrane protein DedA with SNARE-associated domain
LALGIGFAGIVIAGNSRLVFRKFIRICVTTSALLYIVYLGLGLLFGAAYTEINQYLNVFSAFTLVTILAIILMVCICSMRKKFDR